MGTIEGLQRDLDEARRKASDAELQKMTLQEQNVQLERQRSVATSAQRSLIDARQATEELQGQLQERTQALEATREQVQALESERLKMTRELLDFTNDLDIQRRECAKFGSELAALRNGQLAREIAHDDEFASLNQQLTRTKEELLMANGQAKEAHDRHAQLSRELATLESKSRDSALEQRQKYKVQTRRLSAQIEYLKAKYTRENTFRNALALQKKFLLLMVGGMSLT